MRRLRHVAGLAVLTAVWAVPAVSGRADSTNLLANPGFENGVRGWIAEGQAGASGGVNHDERRTGGAALMLPARSLEPGQSMRWSAAVPAETGALYRAGIWLYGREVETPQDAVLGLEFRDARGGCVGRTSVASDSVGREGQWSPLRVAGFAPTEAAAVAVVLTMKGRGTVWLDDAELTATGVGWHVPQSALRFAVQANLPDWMPADLALADVPRVAGTLEFDRETGEPATPVASGDYEVECRPEFRLFSLSCYKGRFEVSVDGRRLAAGSPHGYGRVLRALPAGAKRLRLAVNDAREVQGVGFITREPPVAHVAVPTSAYDPLRCEPLVYTPDGKQVGSFVLWARTGEPLTLLFDRSGGDETFFVYPVDRSLELPRPAWKPAAGVVHEARYYPAADPKVRTFAGFLEKWAQPGVSAGRILENAFWRNGLPFAPLGWPAPAVRDVAAGAPLVLSRWTGFARIRETGDYVLMVRGLQGTYVTIDGGDPVLAMTPEQGARSVRGEPRETKGYAQVPVRLGAGVRRMEVHQYSQGGTEYLAVALARAGSGKSFVIANGDPQISPYAFEPVLPAEISTFQARENRSLQLAVQPAAEPHGQVLGTWPRADMVQQRLIAHTSPLARGSLHYRWRFDDGWSETGPWPDATHVFARTGMSTVSVEVIDKEVGTVAAATSVVVSIQPRWSALDGHPFEIVAPRLTACYAAPGYADTAPARDVLNTALWAWQGGASELLVRSGRALASRIDSVVEGETPGRLLHIGRVLASEDVHEAEAAHTAFAGALQRARAGSPLRRAVACDMAQLLVSALDRPSEALVLIEREGATIPAGVTNAPVAGVPGHLEDLGPVLERTRVEVWLALNRTKDAFTALSRLAGPWPPAEPARVRIAAQLRRIRSLASQGAGPALVGIDEQSAALGEYPLLRLDPEFMLGRIECLTACGDIARAGILLRQVEGWSLESARLRRALMAAKVRLLAVSGRMGEARTVLKALEALAPYGPETAAARQVVQGGEEVR